MTLQRYIDIQHPHVHRTQVTKKRLLTFVTVICVLDIVLYSPVIGEATVETMVTFAFLFNAFTYTKIYLVVRKMA